MASLQASPSSSSLARVGELLGLQPTQATSVVEKWGSYLTSLSQISSPTVVISALCICIIIITPKVTKIIPGPLLALVVATVLAKVLDLHLVTISDRFGEVPSSLPMPRIPEFDLSELPRDVTPALTIAMLGGIGIESLLSVVADGMLGTRHRSNVELVARGVGNLISPLFQGIPATEAIARTATNVRSCGRTPVAAMSHAVIILLIMTLFGSWAGLIPLAALAAILVVVAYNMSEWRTLVHLLRAPRSDLVVLLLTFFLTVLVDLTAAIGVGLILSAFLFLQRMEGVARFGQPTGARDPSDEFMNQTAIIEPVPDGLELFMVDGPLFFGAVERFWAALEHISSTNKILILRMRNCPIIDASGIHALEELLFRLTRNQTKLYFTALQLLLQAALTKAGFLNKLDEEVLHSEINSALRAATKSLRL